jgi:hypothetical protein
MEKDNLNSLIYSKGVVEFVTVANEYCGTIENVRNYSVPDNLKKLQLVLPLLYLKAAMLPEAERLQEDELEKYVTEMDYNILQHYWLQMLGEYDSYYEVFDPDIQFGYERVTASISESLLDIYQDMKEFITSYSIGDEKVMNDALYECILHFDNYWGQRLVNVLRAIHMLLAGNTEFGENRSKPEMQKRKNYKPEWFEKFWDTMSDEE